MNSSDLPQNTHNIGRRNFIKHSASDLLLAQTGLVSHIASAAPVIHTAPELQVPYWIDGKGKQTSAFTLAQHKDKWVFLKCFHCLLYTSDAADE